MSTVTSATASQPTSTAQNKSEGLSSNYKLFLTLLTTQVQNQDPLKPLDSSQYTNQLVQYSSVEQSIQSNKYLSSLVDSMKASQASNYVSYIGATVAADGDKAFLLNGKASWPYSVSSDVTGVATVRDAEGNAVFSKNVTFSKGSGTFAWDGKKQDGGQAEPGSYSISFSVKDANGKVQKVATDLSGKVDSVDFSGDTPYLKVGDFKIPVQLVKTVSRS